jgi:hypothetical protein
MQRSRIRQITLITSLTLFVGCGGQPSINDTADVVRPESAKPATDPAKPATEPAPAAPAKTDPKP